MPKKKSKDDTFNVPVAVQLQKGPERGTIILVAQLMGEIPDDIIDELIAIVAMRTMKKHLDAHLAKVDAIIGDSRHSVTRISKEDTAH